MYRYPEFRPLINQLDAIMKESKRLSNSPERKALKKRINNVQKPLVIRKEKVKFRPVPASFKQLDIESMIIERRNRLREANQLALLNPINLEEEEEEPEQQPEPEPEPVQINEPVKKRRNHRTTLSRDLKMLRIDIRNYNGKKFV